MSWSENTPLLLFTPTETTSDNKLKSKATPSKDLKSLKDAEKYLLVRVLKKLGVLVNF